MSIALDKNKSESVVVLTLLKDAGFGYVLELHSPYTHKTYELNLGTNQSQNVERFDEFHLALSSYTNIEAGRYQYKVYKVVGGNKTALAEVGVAIVKESASLQDEIITPEQDEATDDIIVYEN